MSLASTQQVVQAWQGLQALVPLSVIRTEQHYDHALATLHTLLDLIGDDANHPLYDLLDTLGVLIHAYEEQHEPTIMATDVDVLRWLMEEHALTFDALPELGPPDLVQDVLAGKQTLSREQVEALAQRFGVSPATFA